MKHFYTLEDLTEEQLEAEYREILDAQAIVVRHGNSQANAGEKTFSPGVNSNRLTQIGKRQANMLGQFWIRKPPAIVHSTFLRTGLTAAPTMARFPDVPVEVWPIQEFTYLDIKKYSGTTQQERLVAAVAYWERNNVDHRDGAETETFREFWGRVEKFRRRIETVAPGTVFFSHGQFMRLAELQSEGIFKEVCPEAMMEFWNRRKTHPFPNTTRVAINKTMEWGEPKISHLTRDLVTL